MKRLSLLALMSLFVVCSVSSAQMVSEDYERLLDRGLTNDEPYSYALMREAEAGENREEALRDAVRFSPDLPAAYFELSMASLPDVFSSIRHGLEGLRAYARNFWWSFSLAGLALASALVSLALAGAVVALVRLPLSVPLLSHDINESKAKVLLPLLLLPAALGGPLLFIGGALAVVGIHLKRNGKVPAFVFLGVLAAAPLVLAVADSMLSAASSPAMKAIVAVNEGRDNEYALRVLKDEEGFAERFSYALALKRVGRHGEAAEIYAGLARENPSSVKVLNNLATTYSAMGKTGRAKDYLEQASAVEPSALMLYNLSQLYRGDLNYAAGDKYYGEAAALDRDLVSKYTALAGENPNRFLIDMTYSMTELWWQAMKYRREILTPFPIGKFPAAGLALALIVLAAAFYSSSSSRAFHCSRCDRIVCNICSRDSRWGQMCPDCYSSLVKLQDHDRQRRVDALLAAYENRSRKRKTAKALSFLPPGIAHVYTGRALGGMLLLWAFGFFAAALWLNPFIGTGMAGLSHWWLNPLLILAMAVTYISTTVYISGRLDSGWL
ncbi:MAG: hypothetical protein PVG55_03905 [Nitrospirota bacterium]